MSNRKSWQDYARTTAAAVLNTDVYALQWAHDVRCLRTHHAHRRVGVTSAWLGAGPIVSWSARR